MKLFICGDSTAASYGEELAPMTGWGQALGEMAGMEVVNAAMAGRSSKSFLSEGRLTEVERAIGPGDLLLIQFTHNDNNDLVWRHTDPWTSFMNTLSIFVDTARQHGAQPVLLTPICIRVFRDGVLQPSHDEFPDAIRTLAQMKCVPLIDMYEKTFAYVAAAGEEATRTMYMNLEPGVWPGYPDGRVDDTHTQRGGAQVYARMVAEELYRLGLVEREVEA